MKRLSIIFLSSIFAILPTSTMADQNGTCNLKGGGRAHYHCPDGYDVIIAGDGTDVCDGECYKKGDKASLRNAISNLVMRRGYPIQMLQQPFEGVENAIESGNCANLEPHGAAPFRICPGGG